MDFGKLQETFKNGVRNIKEGARYRWLKANEGRYNRELGEQVDKLLSCPKNDFRDLNQVNECIAKMDACIGRVYECAERTVQREARKAEKANAKFNKKMAPLMDFIGASTYDQELENKIAAGASDDDIMSYLGEDFERRNKR